jgi:aspartokinase-like uncharacterized kinase
VKNIELRRMKYVIKIGGSICTPLILKKLGRILEKIYKKHKFIIIPGGAEFADVVRKFDKKFHLTSKTSDKMAILSMDQYGLFLSDIMKFPTMRELREAKNLENLKKPPIFLPSEYMFKENPLPHSWNVTSDSIAAHIACKINARKVILVKDVDGIFTSNPKISKKAKLIRKISAKELLIINKKTCVDGFLPKILLKCKITCYIFNGKYPERIERIFDEEETICTEILP